MNDLTVDPNISFVRDASNKLVRRSYWMDMTDQALVMVMTKGIWPAPGSEDTELGVFMEPEVSHGKAEVYTRVQA